MSNGTNGTGIHGGNGAEGSLAPFTGHGGEYCTSTDVVVESKARRGETVHKMQRICTYNRIIINIRLQGIGVRVNDRDRSRYRYRYRYINLDRDMTIAL